MWRVEGRKRKTWVREGRGKQETRWDLSFGPAENGIEAGGAGFLSPDPGW